MPRIRREYATAFRIRIGSTDKTDFNVFIISDIPVAISLPHFIKGNRSLVDAIDGIAPNSTKHDSIFAIQPVRIVKIIF